MSAVFCTPHESLGRYIRECGAPGLIPGPLLPFPPAGSRSLVTLLSKADCESRFLRQALTSDGRSAFDLAADAPTRAALTTLWDAAADGDLTLVQKLTCAAAAQRLPSHTPWRLPTVNEASWGKGYSPLHMALLGGARAVEKAFKPSRDIAPRFQYQQLRGRRKRQGGLGGGTPEAVAEKYLLVVAYLLKQGARLEAEDKLLRSPLMLACHRGLLPILELLLAKGGDVHARDVRGNTPLHYAYANRELGAVNKLTVPDFTQFCRVHLEFCLFGGGGGVL